MLHRRGPSCLVGDDFLKQVAGGAGIREILRGGQLHEGELFPDMASCRILDRVIIFPAVHVKDLHQFIDGIIRKLDVLVEPALQTRIAVDEPLHRFGISGYDHDQVIPVILHRLQDRVDCFLAEILILRGKCIGFIDEQYPAERSLNLLLGLERCLTDVPRNQA